MTNHLNRKGLGRTARACALALTLASLTTGCGNLYFHSNGLEALATDARTEVLGVFAKNLAGDLSNTIKGNQTFALDLLRSLGGVSNDTQVDTLLAKSWSELEAEPKTALHSAETARGWASARIGKIDTQLIAAVQEHAGAREKVKNAQVALHEANCFRQRYIETQNLLADVVAINFKQDRPDIASAFEAVFDKPAPSFEGKSKSSCKGKDTVAKLLGLDAWQGYAKAVATGDEVALVERIFKHTAKLQQLGKKAKLALRDPGLSSTILGLGYDLARTSEMHLQAEVDYWKKLKAIRQSQKEFTTEWHAQIQESVSSKGISLKDLQAKDPIKNHISRALTVGDSLRELGLTYYGAKEAYFKATPANRVAAQEASTRAREMLRYALIAVARVHENINVRASKALEFETLATAMLNTRAAVRAEAALKGREALISRGLEGLVAFHKNGITADDMRSLIGLAQFAGLLAIAEGS